MTGCGRGPRALAKAGAVAALLTAATSVWGLGLSPQALRGKQIYSEGVSASGARISARVGLARVSRPGSLVACASCHGPYGRGRLEGELVLPDITWNHLVGGDGHIHPGGRSHPPFTEQDFATAIREGIDPAGNRLDPAMPRYSMVQSDIADLIAYLKRIELDLDPGLSPETIRIGAFLPIEGPLASLGQAMRGMLEACFEQVNADGGVFGRHLELVVADASGDPQQRIVKLEALLDGEVFALVNPFFAGIELQAARLAEEEGMPSLGPFVESPESGYVVNRTTFYLFGGLPEQGRALVRFAATQLALTHPRLGLVVPPESRYAGVADAVAAQARSHGWELVTSPLLGPRRFDPTATAHSLRERGVEAVLLFGSQEDVDGFLGALPGLDWAPYLLMPGSLVGRGLMAADASLGGRLLLAYPSLPEGAAEAEWAVFGSLRERYRLGKDHTTAQISAYTAAKVLVEGLKRAGRDVSRERLVNALEGLHRFRPGLTPALSYGPRRRIGALGAYVVAVDLEQQRFTPVGAWIGLDQ